MSRTLRSQIPVIMPATPAAPETLETLDYRFPAGPATTALDWDNTGGPADRVLQPGEEGWWPVAGARAIDIRPGDRVLKGWKDDDGINRHAEFEAVDFAPYGNLMDSCRVRFTTTTGQLASVGMLQPMALLRRGTRRTLAGSVR